MMDTSNHGQNHNLLGETWLKSIRPGKLEVKLQWVRTLRRLTHNIVFGLYGQGAGT